LQRFVRTFHHDDRLHPGFHRRPTT
jgi:hypothetical protein